jgi:Hemimethylated DNA-binding protein YccV like
MAKIKRSAKKPTARRPAAVKRVAVKPAVVAGKVPTSKLAAKPAAKKLVAAKVVAKKTTQAVKTLAAGFAAAPLNRSGTTGERPRKARKGAGRQMRRAKFAVGQIVRHRIYPFRGVVFDIDPIFANTEEWWQAIPLEVRPRKDQPFYHLLAENADTEYIAEFTPR